MKKLILILALLGFILNGSGQKVVTTNVAADNLVTDGVFNTACGAGNWACGDGWAIAGGTANATATTGNLNTVASPLTVDEYYQLTFTISDYTGGTVRIHAGASGVGTYRSANGTYTQVIKCATNGIVYIHGGTAFTGKLDDVSVVKYSSAGRPLTYSGKVLTK